MRQIRVERSFRTVVKPALSAIPTTTAGGCT
jgi:hypothetical protein